MSLSNKTTNWIIGGLTVAILGTASVPFIKDFFENRRYDAIRATSPRLNSASNSMLEKFVESETPKDSLEAYSNRPGDLYYIFEAYETGLTPELENKLHPDFTWNDAITLHKSGVLERANRYVKINDKYGKKIITADLITIFEKQKDGLGRAWEFAREVSKY